MIEPELGAVDTSQPPHLGAVLRTARESKNLSLEDMSLRVNIPLKHLQALENQEFDKLPGLPFAKGYLRSYAKALGLNADGLVAQLMSECADQRETSVASINKVGQQVQVGHPMMRFSLIVFVIALLGVSVWWWQTQSSADSPSSEATTETPASTVIDEAAEAEVEADPTDIQARLAAKREEMANLEQAFSELNSQDESEAAPGDESLQAGEDEPVYLSDAEIAALANEINQSSDSEQSSPNEDASSSLEDISDTGGVEGSPSSDVAEQGELELVFSGDCWVSIRDASGKLVFANTKRAGETLNLSLDLPASVLVGKVSSVQQARFQGEPLDLAAEAKKDVAKLTLSAN